MEKLLELLRNAGFTPIVKYIRERNLRSGFTNFIVIRGSRENIHITLRITGVYTKLKVVVTEHIDENVLWEIEKKARCDTDVNGDRIYISCSNMLNRVIDYLGNILGMIEEKHDEK